MRISVRFLAASLLLVLGGLVGFALHVHDIAGKRSLAGQVATERLPIKLRPHSVSRADSHSLSRNMAAVFVRILAGNLLVFLLLLCGLWTWGATTVLGLVVNGYQFGALLAFAVPASGVRVALLLTLPHAPLEIAGLLSAAAVGLEGIALGRAALDSGSLDTAVALRRHQRLLGLGAGAVLTAAVIEVTITRYLFSIV